MSVSSNEGNPIVSPLESTAKAMQANLASAAQDLAAGSGPQFEPVRKSPLERILSIITDVRAGEGLGAVLLTADLTVLLGLYYLLKTVRESLILAQGGPR
jgi:hypothetical protein